LSSSSLACLREAGKNIASDLDLDVSEQEILKNFSQRFNKILQRNRVLGLRDHMLSIKVIYLPEELISSFEKNLNYIYKPIFGIR
jgi:hypothetical protein